ncbi:3-methylitaconate isomerase [Paramyrothecium foliicola]|nr:3-methylitaconate isomerase [Paramyrothecium foliicola]
MFRKEDLPAERSAWDAIFLGSIGSPDKYGRQLDGLGGGISSLSKVCVVGKSTRSDADVDYTFVSLGIKNTNVDYSSNCGNMSAAVGPYAVDSGIIPVAEDAEDVSVRIFNTNTGKVIEAVFPVAEGEAQAGGEYSIDGVNGTGAKITLRFLNPAGSRTGRLLPTGNEVDIIDNTAVTLIDAGNPCCFVPADQLGVDGALTPQQISDHPTIKERLEIIRCKAAVLMGLAETTDKVPGSVPKIAIVSAPIDGVKDSVVVRAMSVGQPHRAVPVTVALAAAAAARLPKSTVHGAIHDGNGPELTIHHASGKLAVAADYDAFGHLDSCTVFRTARRLMEGTVFWK